MTIVAPVPTRQSPERPEPLFPKLPPGRTKRSPEETAHNRRVRLMGAMMHAVEQHGYTETTVQELVGLAGVSNTSFYEQFDSVEACFLATCDAITEQTIERIERAHKTKSDPRERLDAVFATYLELISEEPGAAHMVVIESLKLGAAGVAQRQRISESFESALREIFDQAPEGGEVSEMTIRAIVGGFRGIVQRHVRSGKSAQIEDHIDAVLTWAISYQRPGGASAMRLPKGQPAQSTVTSAEKAEEVDVEVWDEHPDSIRSRATLTQRERIVRAAAMVAAESGYAKLSIPGITGAAGVSNQTFYESFTSAQEAFLEAIDILGRRSSQRIAAATRARTPWTASIVAGIEELLDYLAENPLIARLPFIEAIGAGPEGLDRVWMLVDGLAALFNYSAAPAAGGEPLADVIVEAIAGGIYVVIQHEVAAGRTETLPELLPDIAFIALAPLGGA
jgi:AcrR family transcriptional regulator